MIRNDEIPSWAIDWVNTVFTTLYPIETLITLVYDWAISKSFTITWANEITLWYAPQSSIYLDYYDAPAQNPSTWFFLVSELRELLEIHKNDDLPDLSDELFLQFANTFSVDYINFNRQINPWDYIESLDSSINGNVSILLPNFFEELDWIFELDDNGNEKERISRISITWDNGYYIQWDNIYFRWLKKQIRIRYFIEPNILVAQTDPTVINKTARNYELIKNLLNMLYEWWANNEYEEARAWVKYQQNISNLTLNARKDFDTLEFEYDL